MKMWKRLWRTHQHQGVNSNSFMLLGKLRARSVSNRAVSKRSTTSRLSLAFSAFFWNEVIFRPTLPRIRYDGCLQFLARISNRKNRTTSDRSPAKSQSLLLLANTTELITKDKKKKYWSGVSPAPPGWAVESAQPEPHEMGVVGEWWLPKEKQGASAERRG